MKYVYKKKWWQFQSLLVCLCLFVQGFAAPVLADDRSAEIIGSSPLLVPGIITPPGLSGQGQIVGIADSGLDKGSMSDIHPDLQTEPGAIPKVILRSYTDRGSADDPNGHGTFMAAAIAGTGKASDGKYKGIAPGARIYFQALLDKNNNIKIPDNISDLFSPAYSAGVRIHVDGWGGGSNTYSSNTADIDRFVYQHPDFLPVFSAGNSGPVSSTLTTQANSKNALVIGSSQVPRPAFDPNSNYADQADDTSSLGPTADGRIKPDLLAPGSSLISACSSLLESNFTANSAYTCMGGSSMAAAVAGGALALLREQLNSQFKLTDPSSALMKALLINGARSADGNIKEQGYGILDSAGTALALKEGTFKFSDAKTELKEGASQEYKFEVEDPSMPVKITLAWTDPAGVNGASTSLVNNLDLTVKDPAGTIYYGNDFSGQGKVDVINNVEQVAIKTPKAGEYTITVKAGQIGYGTGQDFALVYGQALKTGTVKSSENNNLLLTDNSVVQLDKLRCQQVVDGKLIDAAHQVQAGSEIYLSSNSAYIFGATWKTGGIQALNTDKGDLLLEMNRQVRDGGYYLDPQAAATAGDITVNGLPVDSVTEIPTGSELTAVINPALQTLWKLEASNREVNGFVSQVNPAKQQFKLLNDSHVYTLAPWAAISYQDNILDCTAQDTPYGSVQTNDLESLLPGTKVTVQVSPQTGLVQALTLERSIAIGKITKINAGDGTILLDTGSTYHIFPGVSITRDQKPAKLDDIQVGDQIIAALLSSSSTVIQVQAFSNATYGRVVYFNPQKGTLYLIDSNNHSQTYTFNKQTEVFGWGIQLESSSIVSGSWVRVISDPADDTALRVDLAEIGEDAVKTVSSVDKQTNDIYMTDGTKYKYGSYSRISLGGYCINAEDIAPGDKIELTTLLTPSPWAELLAGADVKVQSNLKAPDLQITARALNGVLIIQGKTSANVLYLYRKDGSHERIAVTNGSFTNLSTLLDNETDLSVVALDTSTGAMKDLSVPIDAFATASTSAVFNDISGNWAEKFIDDLARRNIIKGYEDGGFHPDETINRAELMVIIAQMQNLKTTTTPDQSYFTDYQSIPWWALQAVMAARQAGLVFGYPDGSFQPYEAVTRSELAVIYANLSHKGLVNLFPGETLQPDRIVTRAEAAAILDRL